MSTTVPLRPFNLKKLIRRKRPTVLTIVPNLDWTPSLSVQKEREDKQNSKTVKSQLEFELEVKRFKRSLDRIFMAKYIQNNMSREYWDTFITDKKFDPFDTSLVYWSVCEAMESKKGKDFAFVKNVKSKLVSERFGF